MYVVDKLNQLLRVWSLVCLSLFLGPLQGYCSDDKIPIFVSVAPQAYLVNEIGGKYVSVQTLIPPGQEPHLFAPTPRQIISLGQARLYFKIGFIFEESSLSKIVDNHKTLLVVDMAEDIVYRKSEGGVQHEHSDHMERRDPHIWLGVSQLMQMSVNVVNVLQKIDPFHSSYYEAQMKKFSENLEVVYNKAKEKLRPFRGETLYVFHPAFGYFTDTFGLIQRPVEIEGKSPSPKQLAALIQQARNDQVKVIFVQPQFDQKSAGAVAKAIGGNVEPIDPLAENILQNIADMADSVAYGLGKR